VGIIFSIYYGPCLESRRGATVYQETPNKIYGTSVYALYNDGNEDNICTLYLKDTQQISGGKITNIVKKKFKQESKLWMKEEGILLTKDKNIGRFHYNDTVGYFIMHSVLRDYITSDGKDDQ
jgi:hypothetical protein